MALCWSCSSTSWAAEPEDNNGEAWTPTKTVLPSDVCSDRTRSVLEWKVALIAAWTASMCVSLPSALITSVPPARSRSRKFWSAEAVLIQVGGADTTVDAGTGAVTSRKIAS